MIQINARNLIYLKYEIWIVKWLATSKYTNRNAIPWVALINIFIRIYRSIIWHSPNQIVNINFFCLNHSKHWHKAIFNRIMIKLIVITTHTFLERIWFLCNSSKRYVDYVSRVMYDSQSSNTIKVHHIEPIQLKINPFVRNQRVIFHIFHLLYVGIPTSYRVF